MTEGEDEKHREKEGGILCMDFDYQLPNPVTVIDLY